MQQRSAETRRQILDSAYTLFSKSGYEAASVAEICSAAGISKGAFYHHFTSKQTVFLAILEEWLQGLDQSFSLIRQQENSADQVISQMAGIAGSTLQAADVRLTIILEFWMQASRDPAVWTAAVAPYRRYTAYITEIIRQGINEGSLRETDPEQTARAFVALAMGLLMQAMFETQSVDWNKETRQAVDLLLAGLRTEKHESDNGSDRAYWKRTGSPTASKWAGGKGAGFTDGGSDSHRGPRS